MSAIDSQLVANVTRKVLEAINAQNQSASTPAQIKPPAGLCTAGSSSQPKPKEPCADKSNCTDCDDCKTFQNAPILQGIITANQIQSANSQVIRLAKGARLTPLAKDYIKDHKVTIESVIATSTTASTAQSSWTIWTDGPRQQLSNLNTQFAGQLVPSSINATDAALVEVIKQINHQISTQQRAGGILIVESAALAACFANRLPALRAIVGTNTKAIETGVTKLNANLLVLEYPQLGNELTTSLIEQFINTPRSSNTLVNRLLKELTP